MKNIAILGTGAVGNAIGSKLIELGYPVMMGSRTKGNPKTLAWVQKHSTGATVGTFADAAAYADIIFNCTMGEITLDVIEQAGVKNFDGKILIDVTNPLDFSKGMPPSLLIANTSSLGEEVQKKLPNAHVVKALNTVNCDIMVNPAKAGGEITLLICGNNAEAKATVTELLKQFGWKDIIDTGDIKSARGQEMFVITWVSVMGAIKTPHFGFKVVRA